MRVVIVPRSVEINPYVLRSELSKNLFVLFVCFVCLFVCLFFCFCCWKKEEKKKKARKTIRAHPLDHRGMLAGTSGGFFQCALFFLFPFFRLLFSFFFIKEEVSFTTQEVKVVLL